MERERGREREGEREGDRQAERVAEGRERESPYNYVEWMSIQIERTNAVPNAPPTSISCNGQHGKPLMMNIEGSDTVAH